jgi:co-chaperonin GroES (HSP10)
MSKAASTVVAELRPTFQYAGLEEAFPLVDPGLQPYGWRVLVQMRTPKTRSAGGLYLPPETRQIEAPNTQVAKVIAIGPLAFKNRDRAELWPEGAWCAVGEYVRVPKYGGDRWEVPIPGSDEHALFVIFDDLNIVGRITCDPLSVIAYI